MGIITYAQFLDQPPQGQFTNHLPLVTGWLTTDRNVDLDQILLTGPNGKIAFRRHARPDVEALFPGEIVLGFNVSLERELIEHDSFRLSFASIEGLDLAHFDIAVLGSWRDTLRNLKQAQASKRAWCMNHLRCAICKNPELTISESRDFLCPRCKTKYPQTTGALNFLTPELYRLCSLEETTNVSANGYDRKCYDIVEDVRQRGGKVLDCGAGFRATPSETVINLEIVDFPSTDVLAVGQSLPFRDASFDAVFSIAVLEHVSDPFACAKELSRVLRPGGTLYCHVPFIQPEHGFPNHFYNMTRQGLLNLFPDLKVESHEVPPSGYPMFALHWIIGKYAQYLPSAPRERFLNMRIGDVLSRSGMDWNTDEIVYDMAEEGRWVLACTTALLMRKLS